MWWAELLNNILAVLGDGGGASNSYESIATINVGVGGASNLTFSSIPQIYKHLQIRGIFRSTQVSQNVNGYMTFNSDTGANYAIHRVYGDGSSALAGASTPQNSLFPFWEAIPASTAGANIFGTAVIDILDYTSTNKNKVIRSLCGNDQNGFGRASLVSGLWLNTAAVSTIVLNTDLLFTQYSSFALYGVKG